MWPIPCKDVLGWRFGAVLAAATVGWRKEQQRAVIMRLDRLGWTQEEVAEVVGVTQRRVGQILEETADLQKTSKITLASGIPHLEVAERFNPHAPG